VKKAYIITGATGGLGKLVADALTPHAEFVLATGRKHSDREHYFLGDLKTSMNPFVSHMTRFIRNAQSMGVHYFGLFNSIGIPARVPKDASEEHIEAAMEESMKINYEIPAAIADYFAGLVNEGSIVFLSSQHTIRKPETKRTYWAPKAKLEEKTEEMAEKHQHLKVNVILPGNLGIGMSAGARLQYETNKNLVNTQMALEECIKYLANPTVTGKKILIAAHQNKTGVDIL